MLIPCLNRVQCIDPATGKAIGDPDGILRNRSSEPPDRDGYVDFLPDPPAATPDDPTIYTVQGCKGLCVSEISMAEALLCAQKQVALCNLNPGGELPWIDQNPDDPVNPFPPGGGPNPNVPGGGPGGGGGGTPNVPGGGKTPSGTGGGGGGDPVPYFSKEATCTVACPDGSEFSQTVEAGKFVAKTQALADSMASKYVCAQAAALKMCLGAFDGTEALCLWKEYNTIGTMSVSGQNPPYTLSVAGLPPGVEYEINDASNGVRLFGRPTSGGTFDVVLTATDKDNNTKEKTYVLDVIGPSLEPMSDLPQGLINEAYDGYTFMLEGPAVEPVTWTCGGLPDGLTMSAAGEISGTPTENGDFPLAVTFVDFLGFGCTNGYNLHIANCATDVFDGEETNSYGCNDGDFEQIVQIPMAMCQRFILCEAAVASCSGCLPGYGGRYVEFTVYKGAAQWAHWTSIFDNVVHQFFNVAAKADDFYVKIKVYAHCKQADGIPSGTITWKVSGL